jgi:hypothetical protein
MFGERRSIARGSQNAEHYSRGVSGWDAGKPAGQKVLQDTVSVAGGA